MDSRDELIMDFRVSYAQNREDFLIDAFFPDVQAGHYIDVGAAHPTQYSVTKHFYDRGWTGINVEPIAELADLLRTSRPRDVTLELGLGEEPGTARFRRYAGSGLSTTNAEVIARHAAQDTPFTDDFTDLEITVVTLAEVLRRHPLPHIHFLKIDVEGSEYGVLAGNDWDRDRPELICLEVDHVVRDCAPLLSSVHYEQVFHDGLNVYYLAAESMHRSVHFRYPKAVLDAPVIVTPEVGRELDELARLREEAPTSQAQLAEAQAQLAGAQAALSKTQTELASLHNALAQAQTELAEAHAESAELENALAAETSLRATYATRDAELSTRLDSVEGYLAEVLSSHSWRWTRPLRVMIAKAKARAPMRLKAYLRRRRRNSVAAPAPTELVSIDGAIMLDHLTALDDVEHTP